MEAKLVVVGGKTSKRIVPLTLPTVLGRSREADLTVAHPLISRRHCRIFEHRGLILVRDLGSLNGTRVAGRRIEQAPLLPDGEFTIGPLTFRVLYQYDGDPDSVPATKFVDEEGAVPATEEPIEEAVPYEESIEEAVPFEEADAEAAEEPEFKATETQPANSPGNRQPNEPAAHPAATAAAGPWSDPVDASEDQWAAFQQEYQQILSPEPRAIADPGAAVPPKAAARPESPPEQAPHAEEPAVAEEPAGSAADQRRAAAQRPAKPAANKKHSEPAPKPAGEDDFEDFLGGLQ